MTTRKRLFDAIRRMMGRGFTAVEVKDLDARLDAMVAAGEIEEEAGPAPIGHNNPPAPIEDVPFTLRFANRYADKISDADITRAAARLKVSPAHIRAIMKVEGGGASFDKKGRPIILFEPHIFHRRTGGRFSPSTFSYRIWRTHPYPRTFDGRWRQMADAAAKDVNAALESASWGMFQIMGFHWKSLGYASVHAFVESMVASEAGHLDAVVGFVEANGLAAKLRACRKGDPKSCRAFVKGYNGSGYAANRYHIKFARAL